MTLKAAARWVNVTLKQKGKEVFCILEKFDLFLNSLSHGSIICNVSRVKLLSEFFPLRRSTNPSLVGESCILSRCLPLHVRACLHEGGGPQIGEVTCSGSPHLSRKRDQIKMRDYMDRRVTPPKWVTSPTWVPHLHVNRPLEEYYNDNFVAGTFQ